MSTTATTARSRSVYVEFFTRMLEAELRNAQARYSNPSWQMDDAEYRDYRTLVEDFENAALKSGIGKAGANAELRSRLLELTAAW